MNETVLQYWNRAKQYWNKYTRTQKITLIATVAILVLTVTLVSYNLSKTQYSVAYRDLQPSDAAAIKQYLDGAKIPYRISADGKVIEVPTKEATNVKLDVESQGLNKNGSIGYSAFRDSSAFGTTDAEFQIKHLDALQGEIQQLINANESVLSSKVLITLPEQSVFLPKNGVREQASAAVVVKLKPGYRPDQQQIDTLYRSVAHSVPNLTLDNITISDQNGDELPYSKSGSSQLNTANAVTQQFQIQKAFEQDIQKKVMTILGGVLGTDKVIPMVMSTMNFDQKKSNQQLVTPVVDNQGIAISMQEISKSYTSDSGSAAGGVAGTGDTDVPGYPGSTGSGKTTSEEVQKTVNSEINRITNEIVSSPYTVTDLTISVGVEPPDTNDPTTLTQQTKDAIQRILVNVVTAALANSGRTFTADELTSKVIVFDHNFAQKDVAGATNKTNWLLYGGGALALLLAGATGYAISRRRRKAQLAMEEAAAAAATKVEFPTIDFDNVTNENQARKQLETLAKRKPEDFVNLLRTWLVDE
ncbi:flagellar basal-body MS-ring/collar protein FliF [Paenibacillus cymbidii]|uniref:flagellar basal-body MS-ring/collar protein FliF n=1 Tax=Paenibacillus cymbidii TaxID=1639034 RepID=UPI0010804DE7|nr:flagellar basal-body MS-ring/collar protein FliF [Paenibacillus cymbidii]